MKYKESTEWNVIKRTGELLALRDTGVPKETISDQEFYASEIVRFCREITGFPFHSSGLITHSPAWANLEALRWARNSINKFIGTRGVQVFGSRLVMYASAAAYPYLLNIADLLGIGSEAVRQIRVDEHQQMDAAQLEKWVNRDRAQGHIPFCVVATLGTPQTGAMDPCAAIYDICNRHHLWFHVDARIETAIHWTSAEHNLGPYLAKAESISLSLEGAIPGGSPVSVSLLRNKESDTWLRRSGARALFSAEQREGNAGFSLGEAGQDPCFQRNLYETWNHLCNPTRRMQLLERNHRLAARLQMLVEKEEWLQLMSPACANVVCFRYNPGLLMTWEMNELNRRMVEHLQREYPDHISLIRLQEELVLQVKLNYEIFPENKLENLVQEVIDAGREAGKNFSWSFHMAQSQVA